MDKLQLAMLTQWAEDSGLGGIQGRKRMQKVIYLLQQAGCPIDAHYSLHHYGPYSRDVADVTDVMVAEDLLVEQGGEGGQYDYKLGPFTRPMIESSRTRQTESIRAFEAFHDSAVELLGTNLWLLELGSTILYFFRSGGANASWDSALHTACKYKSADPTQGASQAALALAKRLVPAAA